jgi:hypothetical protein
MEIGCSLVALLSLEIEQIS